MRLWLVLLLLPALPAATGAAAEPFPSCVLKSKKGVREPASLQALLDCQGKKLDLFITDYEAKHGDGPSDETVERWQDLQREEVRSYIRRHPDRSVREGPESKGAPSGKKTKDEDLQGLQKELWSDSDEGRRGVTPAMARKIVKSIERQQGYVSQEMTDLLDALQKEGPNLSDKTVRQLKDAARQADADGLDLGVQPDMKEFLLDR
ncbi:MAG: hypothetical protein HY926_05205 [Elusimicrobia bacterium]|nr:hypothetical protein [Elusimicrobiota bacterium]